MVNVINIDVKIPNGVIQLQGTSDIKYCYSLLRNYFENELLNNSDEISEYKLQRVLNRKIKKIESFQEFTFDSDFRVIELTILIGILETLHRINSLNKDYLFIPAWQIPDQKLAIKQYSDKESWDGFLVGIPKKRNIDAITIPLELKSLMSNPKETTEKNPNDQLKDRLTEFKKHFQHRGSINCVLLMPYTDEKHLSVDLMHATDDLRLSISSQSIGIVALLTFPYSKSGKLTMSILFAVVSLDPNFMTVSNTKEWMCQINFGRA